MDDQFFREIREIGPFSFSWPGGDVENFDQGWELEAVRDGRAHHIRHGLAFREVYGTRRRHSVTFLDDQPRVEGSAADDYDSSRSLISLLKRRDKSHITDRSELPTEYEAFEVVRHKDEISAPRSPNALAVKIPEDDVRQWARHALLRGDGSPTRVPGKRSLHLLLRWSFAANARTIEHHREVAERQGSVWWGKLGDPEGRTPIGSESIEQLRKQISEGIATHVYLYRAGEVWRADLLEITADKSTVDPTLIPDYYGEETHHLWTRLANFVELEPRWPLEHLTLASDPVPNRLERSLRGQASLLLVTELVAEAAVEKLRPHLERILEKYSEARGEPFSNEHPIWSHFQAVKAGLEDFDEIANNDHLSVRASSGQGNWAKVPWIAILDDRITTTSRRGVYVVYLFRQDCSGVYLTLNQGVTEPIRELGARKARESLRQVAASVREQHPELTESGFALDDKIDLRADPGLGASYEDSTIAYKLYETGAVPSDEALRVDLVALLGVYRAYVADGSVPQVEGDSQGEGGLVPDLEAITSEFAESLHDSHVSFGQRHDDLVRSFIASLATKRFTILTGLSGSGKTQMAIRFGEWLGEGRSMLVPVRPDWTGAEALFGFEDALQPALQGRSVWHVPSVLAFMLRAARDLTHPYLLILDEMNLAHVERYFADVLSGIESDYPVLPNLRREKDGRWRPVPDGEERIQLPRNLLLVGTVNVDETTYMFSPKVLDRANVFEFRVGTADLTTDYRRPVACAPGTDALVRGFLSIVLDNDWHLQNPSPSLGEFQGALRTVHELLADEGYEFGHRVFYEAVRFSAMLAAAGEADWRVALDRQVIQKILPRLHGSRRRLERVLGLLGRFCLDLGVAPEGGGVGSAFDPLAAVDVTPALPVSFDKVRRMMRSLRANQFASFAE